VVSNHLVYSWKHSEALKSGAQQLALTLGGALGCKGIALWVCVCVCVCVCVYVSGGNTKQLGQRHLGNRGHRLLGGLETSFK
jgi:hypothetical protein